MDDIQQAPKNNSRLIVLVIILTTLSILTSGWLYYQNIQLQKQIVQLSIKPSPTPTSFPETPPADPTANWKTYNDKYQNYTIRIPEKYNAEYKGHGPLSIDDEKNRTVMTINVEDTNIDFALDQHANSLESIYPKERIIQPITKTLFQNRDAYLYILKSVLTARILLGIT